MIKCTNTKSIYFLFSQPFNFLNFNRKFSTELFFINSLETKQLKLMTEQKKKVQQQKQQQQQQQETSNNPTITSSSYTEKVQLQDSLS